MSTERLPPPWVVVEHQESYEVRAANGITVSFTYFDDEPTRRAITRRPTKDQARRIAAGIARLPEFMRKPD